MKYVLDVSGDKKSIDCKKFYIIHDQL